MAIHNFIVMALLASSQLAGAVPVEPNAHSVVARNLGPGPIFGYGGGGFQSADPSKIASTQSKPSKSAVPTTKPTQSPPAQPTVSASKPSKPSAPTTKPTQSPAQPTVSVSKSSKPAAPTSTLKPSLSSASQGKAGKNGKRSAAVPHAAVMGKPLKNKAANNTTSSDCSSAQKTKATTLETHGKTQTKSHVSHSKTITHHTKPTGSAKNHHKRNVKAQESSKPSHTQTKIDRPTVSSKDHLPNSKATQTRTVSHLAPTATVSRTAQQSHAKPSETRSQKNAPTATQTAGRDHH